MYKFFIAAITVILLLNTASANSQQFKETKNVLIIFGLSPNQPAYIPLLNGIREKLDAEFYEIVPLYGVSRLRRYATGSFQQELFESINKKYGDIRVDLLICIGVNAVPLSENLPTDLCLNYQQFPWIWIFQIMDMFQI